MPEYRAYCPVCDKEQDYFAQVDERDQELAKIECCGEPLRRRMFAPRVDIKFVPGRYDVGLGRGMEYFGSEQEMRRKVDEHNRGNADNGKEIQLVREKT